MSGIEVSKEQKENQVHMCASCMNTVIQTFTHFQDQIKTLRNEKANLHQRIKALEQEVTLLKKESTA